MSGAPKVSVGYVGHVCTNHVWRSSRLGTVTAASPRTADAEFTVKVKLEDFAVRTRIKLDFFITASE